MICFVLGKTLTHLQLLLGLGERLLPLGLLLPRVKNHIQRLQPVTKNCVMIQKKSKKVSFAPGVDVELEERGMAWFRKLSLCNLHID